MAVKLTESQMTTLKSMMEVAENFADQLLHIMRNSKLDRIPGCQLYIDVNPNLLFTTNHIRFGSPNTDAGKISLGKGAYDVQYKPFGENSAEYELLFADENTRRLLQKPLRKEKPLPPDGLWVGIYDDPPAMDCGVSVNDRMAE